MEKYQYITLREKPDLKNSAAEWFHSKWKVPTEAYLECMDAYLQNETEYGWYLCLDGDQIIGGMGVIENDFHDRKDLVPNVCAVFTDEKQVREENMKKVTEKLEEAFAIQEDIMTLAKWYIETDGGNLNYITIPETIDRFIEESGHRYGMVVYSEGYSRTGGNYALEVVKTIGIGILTGWVSAPYKDETHLYLMILDSDTDRIVYNRHCFGEYNPLKGKHIEKALKRTFSDFAD